MTSPTPQDLASLPLFGGVTKSVLEIFAAQAEIVRLDDGEVLYREGDDARALYVVKDGGVMISKRCRPGVDLEVPLLVVKPGEHLGEMSFIDMQSRSATARAKSKTGTPTVLWAWPYSMLHERYCSDSTKAESDATLIIVLNMARELSRRLRRADAIIVASRAPPTEGQA